VIAYVLSVLHEALAMRFDGCIRSFSTRLERPAFCCWRLPGNGYIWANSRRFLVSCLESHDPVRDSADGVTHDIWSHCRRSARYSLSVQDSREIVLKACQDKVTLFLQVDSDESLDTHQAARWLNIDLLRHSHPHLSGGGGHNR